MNLSFHTMVPLGKRLHNERLARKLTLDEVAAATKIKARFLASIEKGEYDKLPSPAYAKGFVRNYAAYLGLPKTESTALFRREFDEKRAYKVLPDSLSKKEEFPLNRIRIQQSLIIGAILIIAFVGYVLFQYRYQFIGPALTIDSPKPNITTSQDITIAGQTDSSAAVTVNDEPVSLASDGKFSKHVTLFPGKATLTIKAVNRFGKETIVQREIVVK
jgi:cytoskeletal protein RodZ